MAQSAGEEHDAGRCRRGNAEAIDAVLKLRSEVLEALESAIARKNEQRSKVQQNGYSDIGYYCKMEINGLESALRVFRGRVDEMLKELSEGG